MTDYETGFVAYAHDANLTLIVSQRLSPAPYSVCSFICDVAAI